MSPTTQFKEATLISMGLAKVGNPLRKESVQTSKKLCQFEESDAELLTHCFLKSFRSLELHRFQHHEALEKNEVYGLAREIFAENKTLLKSSAALAKHLFKKSNHPNIKSGDLCVALIDDVMVDGERVQALSIIKSESKVPFLQVSVVDGDLCLTTQHGIYPDKVDKGCLIINHRGDDGFLVYMFDKSGAAAHFWNCDFLGVVPVKNDDYHTRRYTELCSAFAEKGLPEEMKEEERVEVANRAMSYLAEAETFDLDELKEAAFTEPAMGDQFSLFKDEYEESQGQKLEDQFKVAQEVAKKAKKKLKGRLRLDTGADIMFSSTFVDEAEKFFERGFDKGKGMNFVKLYFNDEK